MQIKFIEWKPIQQYAMCRNMYIYMRESVHFFFAQERLKKYLFTFPQKLPQQFSAKLTVKIFIYFSANFFRKNDCKKNYLIFRKFFPQKRLQKYLFIFPQNGFRKTKKIYIYLLFRNTFPQTENKLYLFTFPQKRHFPQAE